MLLSIGAGEWSPWFLFFPWIWVVVVIVAVSLFRRGRWGGRPGSAEEVVGELYARGEISADEYRERLAVLRRKNS